jgi:L-threonylcarbamoyladenylate synthase
MKVDILPFGSPAEQAAALGTVIRHLDAGGLIATPTETVYGLGCALEPEPLARLVQLKRRAEGQPFLLLVTGMDDAPKVTWTEAARQLASAFWPGPLTLVLAARKSDLPGTLFGPEGTLAIRATPHEGVRALIRAWGKPLPSTSANPRGQPPAESAAAVYEWLRNVMADDHMMILDGGTLPASRPSTIVDCSGRNPRLLREGSIVRAELERIVHDIDPG